MNAVWRAALLAGPLCLATACQDSQGELSALISSSTAVARETRLKAALTDHDTIVLEDVRDLPSRVPADPTGDLLASAAERQLPLAEVERGYIRRVLDACHGNVSRAARILGIDRRTLYRKLE